LIGLYLGKVGVGSAYGAAGSLAVLIVWIYYSAQIFLYGVVFMRVHAEARGWSTEPLVKEETHFSDTALSRDSRNGKALPMKLPLRPLKMIAIFLFMASLRHKKSFQK
jgi:membrane protein